MKIDKDTLNYLCKKYDLKICRLGGDCKLFIKSTIFEKNSYWFLFFNDSFTSSPIGYDWLLGFSIRDYIIQGRTSIEIECSQTNIVLDEDATQSNGHTIYKLTPGFDLNTLYTSQNFINWIESFISKIRKLEKNIAMEIKVKDLEKDFENG